jgi:lipopolysaccharide transport system permease protein
MWTTETREEARLARRAPTRISAHPPSFRYHAHPRRFLEQIWRYRGLLRQQIGRELVLRYRASQISLLWAFLTPVFVFGAYTFVFGIVLKTRWPGRGSGSLLDFSLALFCGLLVFNILSDCLSRSSWLIVSVPSYVKKIVFPLEMLPVAVVAAAFLHGLVSLGLLTAVAVVLKGSLPWTVIFLPVVLLPLLGLCLGLSWLVSSLGLFFRDLGPTLAVVLQLLMLGTPVFYPLDIVPMPWRILLSLNPLAIVVENTRRSLLWGMPPAWLGLSALYVLSAVVLVAGYLWFMRTRWIFADVA